MKYCGQINSVKLNEAEVEVIVSEGWKGSQVKIGKVRKEGIQVTRKVQLPNAGRAWTVHRPSKSLSLISDQISGILINYFQYKPQKTSMPGLFIFMRV